ncbi:DUF4344 domain-containing metallopeptidase [Streptomyces sp. NBC_00211]|uniref:DUF4344 domain-containing metallopeptidase n=1 Tax=Streptomyces sp. NBC_00211 TaxID=2975683 RepID=UPI00386F5335
MLRPPADRPYDPATPLAGKGADRVLSNGGHSSAVRTAVAGALFIVGFTVVSCTSDDGKDDAKGKVTVVYEDDTIEPKDRQAVEVIRKSRVLEQAADWMNKSVALPHDLAVKVTGKLPPGVTDAVAQPDGRTIYVSPAFLTQTRGLAGDVAKTVKRPALFPQDKYNADDLTALSTQFVFGHELGHALQRQLMLPNLGLEEDAADGFASFYTVNEVGPDPSLAGALVFDEAARRQGELTLEGLSSDHPVTQQRVFNFLCSLYGSDPKKFGGPLVDTGYLPKSRAPLCPQAWAMLDNGWWTQLQPHFTSAFKDQGDKRQADARAQLIAETKAFAEKLDEIRSQQ